MVGNFVDPFLKYLLVECYDSRWSEGVDPVRDCISELRFLNMFLWWFGRWDKDDCGEENFENMKSMLHIMASTLEKLVGVLAEHLDIVQEGNKLTEIRITRAEMFSPDPLSEKEDEASKIAIDFVKEEKYMDVFLYVFILEVNWQLWIPDFEGRIEECKLHVRGYCPQLLNCTFNYRSTPGVDQIPKFLDAIIKNLKALARCIDYEIVPLQQQIETFEEKLMLFHALFKLIPDDCILELSDFRTGLYNDINKVACLTFFYWGKAGDEEIAAKLSNMLSDMLQKITKPDIASWYFRVLKAMRLQQSDDAVLLGQAVPGFLDLMFENLGVPLNEDFQIQRDGLIILFTFLANPPEEYTEDEELCFIRDQIGDLLCQESVLVPPVDSTRRESRLSDFMTMIERLKSKIRIHHNDIPDFFSYNFPKTNGLGFIDFLLQNFQEHLNSDKTLIPFAKHLFFKMELELASLRPDLDDMFELQNEHKELQDTWLQLTNLAYLIEYVVNSCYVVLYPIWCSMVFLADILDEIKAIKRKLHTFRHCDSDVVLPHSVGFIVEIPERASCLGANEVMVGFEQEVDTIVGHLTRGPKSLEIISIVGMGGSGKTTLARNIYYTKQVRAHFHVFAFCTVSQVYSPRKLLLDILSEVKVGVGDIGSKTQDDLAHLLHKQLSGRRYLVVMDDIWNADAWEKVKNSFPDNNEGSRVIFTNRERQVAMKAKSKVHSKHLLSDKESWELLQKKAFPQAICSEKFSKVGQVIARNCKGLPLAVAVVGRLLARKERSLRLWNEIAEKTSSFAVEEGCMDALELSYKHLPEHLKLCFLYLGVFAEDELIPSKRLMLLWIAEGLVLKPQRKCVEIVAEEYLTELVDRNLVQIATRCLDNGIKTCQVHDVIRDFCQRKAQEENLFQLINGSPSNRYRVCLNKEYWKLFFDAELTAPGIKSLLYHGKSIFVYDCKGSKLNLAMFPLIQILDLEKVKLSGSEGDVNRILESISSLIHLRYLALSMPQYAEFNVPLCMGNLKNLEICIFRGNTSWSREIFWKMQRLRHVDIGNCWVSLYLSKLEVHPPLENVECFSSICVTPGTAMTLLEMLPNVRKLSCHVGGRLGGQWDLAFDLLSKLESLKVTLGYGVHAIFPDTLKKLYLNGCGLSLPIGKLSRLEVLMIDSDSKKKWDIEDGEFPMLKFLKLKRLKLKEWSAPDGSFPRLEKLVVVRCFDLKEIPASFQENTTLKKIEVGWLRRSLRKSAVKIRDEQKDLGNEIELIFSPPWE